jgi:hypothetical protein
MRILNENRLKVEQQTKIKQYADEVKKTNLRKVNKYLVPLNPRIYMAPRLNPNTQLMSPKKLSLANPDLIAVDEGEEQF